MRLIDADRLLRPDMIRMCYHLPNGDIAMPIGDIKHAPTVDAAPVVHGRWEDYGYCSCCGWGWGDLVYDKTEQMSHMSYCPNCGSEMDLKED